MPLALVLVELGDLVDGPPPRWKNIALDGRGFEITISQTLLKFGRVNFLNLLYLLTFLNCLNFLNFPYLSQTSNLKV